MPTTIKWNDRFNLGVESIDKAHQKLFSIVHKMVNLNDDEKTENGFAKKASNILKIMPSGISPMRKPICSPSTTLATLPISVSTTI